MTAAESFRARLKALADLADARIDEALAISREEACGRGACFIRAGEIPTRFAFLAEGLFRYHYLDAAGREYTKGFLPEGSFLSSYSAMVQGRESPYSVEALEPSRLLVLPYRPWRELAAGDSGWARFLIALLELGYAHKEARERELLLLDAEQRYLAFQRTWPGLEARLRQHHVASFLGITPVALSRIRRRLRA